MIMQFINWNLSYLLGKPISCIDLLDLAVLVNFNYEKKVKTVMVNNSTIISKMNYLLFQSAEHKKTTTFFFAYLLKMTLDFTTKLECRICLCK